MRIGPAFPAVVAIALIAAAAVDSNSNGSGLAQQAA
jgi:hypothetical protein